MRTSHLLPWSAFKPVINTSIGISAKNICLASYLRISFLAGPLEACNSNKISNE
jgi:hypothetical protein